MKFILLFGLLFISIFWKITSPNDVFQKFLQRLREPKTFLLVFFQFLPLVQIFSLFFFNRLIFSWSLGRADTLLEMLGLFLFFSGTIFVSWAKWEMKENWGAPAQHEITHQKKLVTTGPFAYTRNPIYFGLLVLFLGFEMALHSYFIFLTIPLYFFEGFLIRQEERLLENHFGKTYIIYKKNVPRFFSFT